MKYRELTICLGKKHVLKSINYMGISCSKAKESVKTIILFIILFIEKITARCHNDWGILCRVFRPNKITLP